MDQLNLLKNLINNGLFHHATWREIDTVWAGLWFYAKDPKGFRGFSVAGCVSEDSPEFEQALNLVKDFGISIGSYGNG